MAAVFNRSSVFSTLAPAPNPAVEVGFYCCAYYAVSRERLLQTPLAVWTEVYTQLIVQGTCVPGGPADMDQGKHEGGGAFEHLAHVIFGASPLKYVRRRRPFELELQVANVDGEEELGARLAQQMVLSERKKAKRQKKAKKKRKRRVKL